MTTEAIELQERIENDCIKVVCESGIDHRNESFTWIACYFRGSDTGVLFSV